MTSTAPAVPAVPAVPFGADDRLSLAAIVARFRGVPGGLLPLLHAVQDFFGYVPPDAAGPIAQALNLSRAEVHGVVTYYHFFRSTPPGRHVVQVCRAESCKAMGGDALMAHVEARLGCASHATRADGAVSLEPVYCLGLCPMSPALTIDDQPYARMNAARFDRLADTIGIAA